MYLGDPSHGIALRDMRITAGGAAARDILVRQCAEQVYFIDLSSVRLGLCFGLPS
jgi:hypothetical protein